MRFPILLGAIAYAGLSMACDPRLEFLMQECVNSTSQGVSQCGGVDDYTCLCHRWEVVLGCYSTCEDERDASEAYSSSYYNCHSGTPVPSSVTTGAASTSSSPVNINGTAIFTTTGPPAQTTTSDTTTNDVTSAPTSSTTPNGAVVRTVPAPGTMVAVMGLIGELVQRCW